MVVDLTTLRPFLYVSIGTLTVVVLVILHLGRTVSRRRIGLATLTGGVLSVAATIPMPDLFADSHVLYGVATCAVPVVGGSLIARSAARWNHEPHRLLLLVLGIIALVPGALGYYATNIEPNELKTTRYTLTTDDGAALRIAVLADIQSTTVGAHEREAIAAVNAQHPDIVLYAGDLYSGENSPFPAAYNDFVDLLSGIQSKYGTFIVRGDHDWDHNLAAIARDAHVTLLENKTATIDINGKTVNILGLMNAYEWPTSQALLTKFGQNPEADFNIVLSHHPDVISNAPESTDLVTSGHTHGGQIQLPFIGPVVTMASLPRKVGAGGLFDYGEGRHLLVTRGVGVEEGLSPKVRFGVPPEVVIIDVNSVAQG